MIAPLVAHLQADTTLAALLPGGVYDATEVGVVSRQTTPGAFDSNQELRPCALVQARTVQPAGGAIDAALTGVTIYFYQRTGFTQIDQARQRVYALLHLQRLATLGASWALLHREDVLAQYDGSLRAQLQVSRYLLPLLRRS